jgi:hypothetical protein
VLELIRQKSVRKTNFAVIQSLKNKWSQKAQGFSVTLVSGTVF